MQLIKWDYNNKISKQWQDKKVVLAMGGFDALHLGHREILKNATAIAYFATLPAEIMSGNFLGYIRNEEQRLQIFNKLGLKVAIRLDFSCKISKMSASSFLQSVYNQLPFSSLITGSNFRLGNNREWGCSQINNWATINAVNYNSVELYTLNNTIVSSSQIRSLIKCGSFCIATSLLANEPYILSLANLSYTKNNNGYEYNLKLCRQVLPQDGIYNSQQGRVVIKQKILYIKNKTDNVVFKE
jgi:riboflavin kinase/FMN adenylyltransferase